MTTKSTDVFEAALSKRDVGINDIAQQDDEIWVIHPITADTDRDLEEMARLVSTFIEAYERYDDVNSLKSYVFTPGDRGYKICWCTEEMARQAAETIQGGGDKRETLGAVLKSFIDRGEEFEIELALDEIEDGEFALD